MANEFTPLPAWAGFASIPPQLHNRLSRLTSWPSVDQYTELFPTAPFGFDPQNDDMLTTHGGYERTIAATGSIPTRSNNWHDWYNALCWELFPTLKTALHASQIQWQDPDAPNQRSPQQNGATLFDECGVIIITTRPTILDTLRYHRWTEAFVDRRCELIDHARLLTVGHALYEKYREPYLGLTAKWIGLSISEQQFAAVVDEPQRLYALADSLAARCVPMTPRDLHPLPLLGWPGWDAANSDASYYANEHYFRPKR